MSETVGLIIGLLLTVSIYSYILGDNPLYRLAIHILVGLSAGYASVVVFTNVIWPAIGNIGTLPLTEQLLSLVPIFLGLPLLLPYEQHVLVRMRLAALVRLKGISVATLIGIGAATALVGNIAGTLIPQTAAVAAGDGLTVLSTALLTACVLLYFHFTVQPQGTQAVVSPLWQRILGGIIGRALLMITFGVLFARTLNTSLTLLTAHLNDIYQSIPMLISGG